MALECIKGTDVPIVDVVKEAETLYVNEFKRLNGPFGMCQSFLQAIRNKTGEVDHVWCCDLSDFVPLFCKPVAKTRFGADTNNAYWWPANEPAKRLEYFDWLIEQYSKEI